MTLSLAFSTKDFRALSLLGAKTNRAVKCVSAGSKTSPASYRFHPFQNPSTSARLFMAHNRFAKRMGTWGQLNNLLCLCNSKGLPEWTRTPWTMQVHVLHEWLMSPKWTFDSKHAPSGVFLMFHSLFSSFGLSLLVPLNSTDRSLISAVGGYCLCLNVTESVSHDMASHILLILYILFWFVYKCYCTLLQMVIWIIKNMKTIVWMGSWHWAIWTQWTGTSSIVDI